MYSFYIKSDDCVSVVKESKSICNEGYVSIIGKKRKSKWRFTSRMFVKLSVSRGQLDLNNCSLPIDCLAHGWQWLPLKTFAIPSSPIAVSPKSITMPMEPMVTLQPINCSIESPELRVQIWAFRLQGQDFEKSFPECQSQSLGLFEITAARDWMVDKANQRTDHGLKNMIIWIWVLKSASCGERWRHRI